MIQVLTPPTCPTCPNPPLLWKDTTTTRPGADDNWTWWCGGCQGRWQPTTAHKEMYTYGTPAGSPHTLRTADA